MVLCVLEKWVVDVCGCVGRGLGSRLLGRGWGVAGVLLIRKNMPKPAQPEKLSVLQKCRVQHITRRET